MTEIGEAIAIGMVDSDEVECPFDHENPEPPNVNNMLIGNGQTLARQMEKGNSTFLYDKLRKPQQPINNPGNIADHPFYNKKHAVTINYIDKKSGEIKQHTYPVSCAAHHIIPAQESLKNSPLLTFMVKKGDSEKLKGKEYTTGSVWSDVGYDINGSENGIFLPGSYAVGGGKGRQSLWIENDDDADDEEENISDNQSTDIRFLHGELNQISKENRKWLYVSQAMKHAPGQFHDRHEDYSLFIAEILHKIFSDYKRLYKNSFKESNCPKCKEKQKVAKDKGIPTPFGLLARLNQVSSRLKNYLNGNIWSPNVYTSKWGKAFMEQRKSGNSDAKIGLINDP